MAYKLIWEKSGMIFNYSGHVTSEDAIKSNEQYYGDERSDDITYQIVDFSAANKITIDKSDIQTIAAMDNVHFTYNMANKHGPNKIVFIGNNDNIELIKKLYQSTLSAIESELQVHYFNDIKAARIWLG